jgi:hypothetical protein
MPSSLYNLNSKYGTEEELIACVKELQSHGFKVLGDAVLNHRCAQRQDAHGVWNLYDEPTWDQRAIVGEWVGGVRGGMEPIRSVQSSCQLVQKTVETWQ